MCGKFLESSNLTISGKTDVYCVIGDPVDHSMSPIIQNAAFKSAGIDAVYVPFQVKPSDLRYTVNGLRSLGIKGFNVTAPHKVAVIRFLDRLDDAARQIGSVNTVVKKERWLSGYNTDGLGALRTLEEAGVSLRGKTLLLFGAGGAARAIAYTTAPQLRAIRLVNRTLRRAKQLERRLRNKFNMDVSSIALSNKVLRRLVEEAEIVVNASSMGMDGRADVPVRNGWLHSGQWVFDIVYKPIETSLLRLASQSGARTINGLDMLVNQGAYCFELWTGRAAPVLEMRHAIAQELLAMSHAKNS